MQLKNIFIVLLIVILSLYKVAEAQTIRVVRSFYVSVTNGNDDWSGKLPDPSDDGTDGPFQTIEGAINEIRKYRKETPLDSVDLYIRGGLYRMTRTIYLNHEDTGLSFLNYNNEEVNIVGSATINPRKLRRVRRLRRSNGDRIVVYKARYRGKCSMNAYIGEKRLHRARKPNIRTWTGENMSGEGPYLRIRNLLKTTPTCNKRARGRFRQNCPDENKNGFKFKTKDIIADWMPSVKSSEGVDLIIFQAWTAERGRIKTINEKSKIVTFEDPLRFAIGSHPKPSGWRYIVENVLQELDAEGEYFCDEKKKVFYVVMPLAYQTTETINIAQLDRIFRIKHGRDISFHGLNFKYTDNRNGFQGYNEAMAAIEFHYCHNVTVTRCAFHHIGYNGVYTVATPSVTIEDNDFKDIGYMGVAVDYRNKPDRAYATKDVYVNRNNFKGCGILNMFQPSCIHVRGIRNINVAWNHVQQISYAGIRVGWQKMFEVDHVEDGEYVFTIENNLVHHHGLGILNDFGGIYLATNAEDCKIKQDLSLCNAHAMIRQNVVHSGRSYFYGGSGVFGDAATSSLHIERNWLYRLGDSEIIFHCGQRNVAKDNVLYHTSNKKVIGTCNPSLGNTGRMPLQTFSFLQNVVFVNNTDARMWRKNDGWDKEVPIFHDNIYFFSPASKEQFQNFFPKNIRFRKWQNKGEQDDNSEIANPLFEDIEANDYRFKSTSPAARLPVFDLDLRQVRDMDLSTL